MTPKFSLFVLALFGLLCCFSCDKNAPDPPPSTVTPELLWQTAVPSRSLGPFPSDLAVQLRVAADKLVLFLGDTLIAFHPDGQVAWVKSYPFDESNSNLQPVFAAVAEPYVLVRHLSRLDCIDLQTGNTVWSRSMQPLELPVIWRIDPLGTLAPGRAALQLDSTLIQLLDLQTGQNRAVRKIGHAPYTDIRYMGLQLLPDGDTLAVAILVQLNPSLNDENWRLLGIPLRPDKPVFHLDLAHFNGDVLRNNPFHVQLTNDLILLEFQDSIRAYDTNGALRWLRPGLVFSDPRFSRIAPNAKSYLMNNILFGVEPLKQPGDTILTVHEMNPATGADIRIYNSNARPSIENHGNHILYSAQAPGRILQNVEQYRQGNLWAYNLANQETRWDHPLPDSIWLVAKRYPFNQVRVQVNAQAGLVYVLTDKYLQCYKWVE